MSESLKKNYEFRKVLSKGKYFSGRNIEAFIKENMDGMDTNQRKDIIINEYYWIDILDNIDTITKEYNEFNIIK